MRLGVTKYCEYVRAEGNMWGRFWEEMNGEMTDKDLKSGCPKLNRFLTALASARETGAWEDKPDDEDHPEDEDFTHKLAGKDIGLFSMHFGAAFDGFTDRGWWYAIFAMARAMAIGISLGVISDGKTNSGTILGLFLMDWFVKVVFTPFIDIGDMCNEIITSSLETTQMGTIFAFTHQWVSASWLENAFQSFSVVGFVPSFAGIISDSLASLSEWFPAIGSFIYHVYQKGGSLTCIFTGSRICFRIAKGEAKIGALKELCIHVAHDCMRHEETPAERKQREAKEAEEAASRGEIYASSCDSASFTASAVLEDNRNGSLSGARSPNANYSHFDLYRTLNTQPSHFNWNAGTVVVNDGQDAPRQATICSRLEYTPMDTPRESISLVPDQLEMPPRMDLVPVQSIVLQEAWAPHVPTVPRAPVPPSQPDPLGRNGSPVPPRAPVPPSPPDPLGRNGSADVLGDRNVWN